jgi:hypothetical protein
MKILNAIFSQFKYLILGLGIDVQNASDEGVFTARSINLAGDISRVDDNGLFDTHLVSAGFSGINPASGLPMAGAVDVAGNAYGTNLGARD